jgi:short subunit dehydrogenase-like uncharacterized protein
MADGALLIYGSYGYSGKLILERALEVGLRPILAGRDRMALERQARAHGLESRVARVDDGSSLDDALQGVCVVLHCAGPFIRTSRPMADACIRSGAHYLDITGEIPVFEALAARDVEARSAGVMLLPGVGFDVVPTDCLAVHLARRLPGSSRLTLAFQSVGGISRGTAETMVANLPRGSAVRRDGVLHAERFGHATRRIDFGRGERLTVAHPWGDLSTAYRSTGIPNIEVYRAAPRAEVAMLRVVGMLRPLLGTAPAQRLLRWSTRRGQPGPDSVARRTGFSRFWGEVLRDDGARATARLHAPEAYSLTAYTAVECATRALRGEVSTGFATPAMAYGPDLVLSVSGVHREDLD